MLYIRLLGKAQLSQKNRWLDGQGRVYFIYPIHQMATDMNKSETTIKEAMKELVKAQLLEKIPEGRGRLNWLYILFPDEEQGQKFAVGNPTGVGRKIVGNQDGKPSPSKYISNNRNSHLRDYDYEEEESF